MNDSQALDPIALTRALCEIESTTYREGAVGDFLARVLAERGWEVEKTPVPQPPESVDGGPRWNIYAGIAGQKTDLVFSTHMDTVPPYIPFSEDAEFMYGRGVSDAKGIIAAQVAAAVLAMVSEWDCCLFRAKSGTRPARWLPILGQRAAAF